MRWRDIIREEQVDQQGQGARGEDHEEVVVNCEVSSGSQRTHRRGLSKAYRARGSKE